MIAHFVFAAAAVAAIQPPASALSAGHENTRRERSEVCYLLATGGAYPPLDVRDCLSLRDAPDGVFRSRVCDYLRDSEQLQDYRFASRAECIRQGLGR